MIQVVDLGSQYTMLIARRIREMRIFSEITGVEIIKEAKGVILSGGPASVYDQDFEIGKYEEFIRKIISEGKPLLGICLGMQLISKLFGGDVKAGKREYGDTEIIIRKENKIFEGIPKRIRVWMSHGDYVEKVPKDFDVLAVSESGIICAIKKDKIYGLQFHPEVAHTQFGKIILENFVKKICQNDAEFNPKDFISEKIKEISERAKSGKIIIALSGGVDSSVTYKLCEKAVGDRVIPIFVDTGLMRKRDIETIKKYFPKAKIIDAREEFLNALKGVTDPEKKRRIIGHKFIEVFEREASKIKDVKCLAQGTLYPDRIESKSQKGPSATIKTHHNVGGLPEKLGFELIEPLRDLFKDEVREIGRALSLPDEICGRHPFPGPGLAVRIIGEVTKDRLDIVNKADEIFIDELKKSGLYDKIWQAFCVFLPVKTVGVMGDKRTYENVIALRAVESTDGMTANPAPLPYDFLFKVANRIIREVEGVNRVVYDVSSKPPATIEWE